MSGAWGVQTEEIIEWASRYEAAAVLPDLVRRLLLATAHVEHVEQFELLEMRTGAGVREPGYDGIVVARAASPFCPQGVSAWELSTESDPKRKATSDIRKREKSSPAPIVPADATYVAVTAQRFRDKHRWVSEQLRRGAWLGVKVIDADDISLWLGQCPAVAHWFMTEQLGRPIFGWRDVRSWRRRWEQRTSPALPGELVLVDRGPQVDELRRWLEGLDDAPGSVLRIRAEHRDEACLFVAAAVTAGVAEGSTDSSSAWWSSIAARALVVETKDAWRVATVLDTSTPLILIPAFSDFDSGDRSARHSMVIPMDPSQGGASPMEIRIDEPLPWRETVGWLSKVLPGEQAERKARESGGHLTALQRSLEGMAAPAWAQEQPRTGLIAMVLMGAWEPTRPADRDVAKVLGVDPDELESLCVELTKVVEPPVTREGRGWRWVSHADAWRVLCEKRSLSDSELDRFREIAKLVLGEDDPRYELPKEERWYALARGKALACSEMLRAGVAESLVRLALADPQLASSYHEPKGAPLVELIVEEVLGPHWVRWASLSELLPVLAEAAPRAFLKAFEASLDLDVGVARLFHEEPRDALGHAPHVGLLWALETLGWDPPLIRRVVHALSELSERDPGGVFANRPERSLRAIFDLFAPQTLANDGSRREQLEELAKNESRSRTSWIVMLGLLKTAKGGGGLPQSRQPRFRPWAVPTEPTLPSWATVHERAEHVLQLVLDAAGDLSARWVELIADRYDLGLPEHLAEGLLAQLVDRATQIEDPKGTVWRALRRRLEDARRAKTDTKQPQRFERLCTTYRALTPSDSVVRALPLFVPPYSLPEPYEGWQDIKLNDAQDEFLRQLAEREDIEQVLEHLIEDVAPEYVALAMALGRSSMAEDVEHKLLYEVPTSPWGDLVEGFVRCRRAIRGFDWFAETARRLVRAGRFSDATRISLALVPTADVWQLLDELGEPTRGDYWKSVSVIVDQDSSHEYLRALRSLIKARNAKVAIELAAHRVALIPSEELLQTLYLVAETLPETKVHQDAEFVSSIVDVLDALWARDDVDQIRAARVESVLATRHVSTRDRKPRFLSRVLGKDPAQFVQLVELVYRPEAVVATEPSTGADTSAEPETEARKQERAKAMWAYRVLESWSSFPGIELEDADERERTVYEWAHRALDRLREVDRAKVGELEIAKVLTRVPAATDGHWPCLATRRLLETGQYLNLARGLAIAKYNAWSMVVRVFDDGTEQATLAEGYVRSAIALGKRWPRTAAMLEELVAMHRSGADQDAKRAHEERIAGGYARHPAQAVRIAPPSVLGDPAMTPKEASILSGLRCTAVGPAPSLSVDFGSRLNLITGDNGLGKTFLLDVAWWVLTGSWIEGKLARPFGGLDPALQRAEIQLVGDGEPFSTAWFDARHERWDRPPDWPRTDALVIYARVDGGFSVWDPELMTMGSVDPETSALDISRHELWFEVKRGDVVLCKGLLADWIQWQSRQPDVFEHFFGLVRTLFEGDVAVEPGGVVPFSLRDAREVPTIKLPYDEVRVDLLSAGMKRVLGLAYIIQWALGRHRRARRQRTLDTSPWSVILLFDEVEAHLHPRWQRTLLPVLLQQLAQLGGEPTEAQVIATTHAPFVAASCETIVDAERDELFVFEEHEGQVMVENVEWAKHGDITNWVTSPVFGLARARSLEAERAIEAAYAFMRGEPTGEPELATREQIHARLHEVLSGTDPFWPRWVVATQDGAAQ